MSIVSLSGYLEIRRVIFEFQRVPERLNDVDGSDPIHSSFKSLLIQNKMCATICRTMSFL